MIIEEDIYLEHFGTKGMRWGVRRNPKTGVRPAAQALNDSAFGRVAQRSVDSHNKRVSSKSVRKKENKNFNRNATGKQVLGVGLGSYAAYSIGAGFVAKSLARNGGDPLSSALIGAAAGVGAGVVGYKATRRLMINHGKKKAAEISTKPTTAEANRQVEEFIKKNRT